MNRCGDTDDEMTMVDVPEFDDVILSEEFTNAVDGLPREIIDLDRESFKQWKENDAPEVFRNLTLNERRYLTKVRRRYVITTLFA